MSLNFFKRGNIQELPFVIGIAIFFIIISLFGFKILNALNDEIQNSTIFPNESKEAHQSVTTQYPSLMDGAFLLVFISIYLGVLVSSWYIDTNPLFFVLTLIVLIAILSAIAVISNVNEAIVEDTAFADIIDQFPIMVFVSNNMFPIAVVMSAGILIALYAKSKNEEGSL